MAQSIWRGEVLIRESRHVRDAFRFVLAQTLDQLVQLPRRAEPFAATDAWSTVARHRAVLENLTLLDRPTLESLLRTRVVSAVAMDGMK